MPATKPSGMPTSDWEKMQQASGTNTSNTSTTSNAEKPSGMPTSAWAESQGQTGTSINPEYNTNSGNSITNSTSSNTGVVNAVGNSEAPSKSSGTTSSVKGSTLKTVTAEENQAYYDATKTNKEAYSPNSQGYTNTGTGAESALGTKYSWEDKAQKLAGNTYSQKVLEEKQNLLTNRQTMEQNAQQYQTQADMKQYSDNQAADKVGWTGGYVLDQERQQEYLKASIQAQLYGAMELQKYGYDTAMSAARLAYDSNMVQYAQEYYNQAVQNSLNEAQITGTYFSAEVKDMLGQNTIAEQAIKDYESKTEHTEEEDKAYERAKKVQGTIRNWFEENHISKAGIKTLEAWNAEQSFELQWSQELWTKYQAALEATKEDVTAINKFLMLDENGNVVYDGTATKVGNWDTISTADKLAYASQNQATQNQLLSYLEGDIRQKVIDYKNSTYNKSTEKYSMNKNKLSAIINTSVDDVIAELEKVGDLNDKEREALNSIKDTLTGYKNSLFKEQFPSDSLLETENYTVETLDKDTQKDLLTTMTKDAKLGTATLKTSISKAVQYMDSLGHAGNPEGSVLYSLQNAVDVVTTDELKTAFDKYKNEFGNNYDETIKKLEDEYKVNHNKDWEIQITNLKKSKEESENLINKVIEYTKDGDINETLNGLTIAPTKINGVYATYTYYDGYWYVANAQGVNTYDAIFNTDELNKVIAKLK